MTVQELLIDATYDVLSRTLAPELAQRLTEEIVERARRGIEEGLTTFFGFEMGKATGRGKQAKTGGRGEVTARIERRRRQNPTSEGEADEAAAAGADDESTAAEAINAPAAAESEQSNLQ